MNAVLTILHAMGTLSFAIAAIWNIKRVWRELITYHEFDAMSAISSMGCFIAVLWGILRIAPGALP